MFYSISFKLVIPFLPSLQLMWIFSRSLHIMTDSRDTMLLQLQISTSTSIQEMLHQDALKRTVISRTPYTAPSTAKAENVFLLSPAHMHNNNSFQAANILYHSSFPVNTQCNVSVSTQPGIHYEQTCRRCQPPLLHVRIYVFEKEWGRENIVTHLLSETKKI